MQMKTITYTDLNGKVRTEDFYFHMEFTDVLEMELKLEGGLEAYLNKIAQTEDGGKAYLLFKDFVLDAYGEKSDDGRRFIKVTDEGVHLKNHFAQMPAMSNMIVEFVRKPELGMDFINSLIPADMIKMAQEEAAKQREAEEDAASIRADLPTAPPKLAAVNDATPTSATGPAGTDEKTKFEDFTKEELLEMSDEKWKELFGTDANKWSKNQLLISMQRRNSQ